MSPIKRRVKGKRIFLRRLFDFDKISSTKSHKKHENNIFVNLRVFHLLQLKLFITLANNNQNNLHHHYHHKL